MSLGDGKRIRSVGFAAYTWQLRYPDAVGAIEAVDEGAVRYGLAFRGKHTGWRAYS